MRDQRKYHIDGSLLINLQHQVLTQLSELLNAMFNSLDDALFELAENAKETSKQNQYFDVMHSMRLQKDNFCSQFKSGFTQQFRYIYNHREPAPQQADGLFDLNSQAPSTLQEAMLELSQTLENNEAELLNQLTERLNHYFNIDSLTPQNMPLGSRSFIALFCHTLNKLDATQSLRLVLCEYFKRFVVNKMRPLLIEANQVLIRQGILPKVNIPRKPSPSKGHSETVTPSFQEQDVPLSEASFSQLQKILSRRHELSLNSRLFAVKQNHQGPALDTKLILSLLSRLRDAHVQTMVEEPSHEHQSHYEPRDLRLLLEHQLGLLVRQRGNRMLHQADDNVITLVASAFEMMHDDPNYPQEMAQLLSQFQLPVMQTALTDKSFFSDPKHPMRRLIKIISLAAIGWERQNAEVRDLLHEEFTSILVQLLQNYHPGVYELIENLEKDFQKFIIMETKRARQVEQKTLTNDSVTTRHANNTSLVNQLIQDRTQGKILPISILYMIKGPFATLLKNQLSDHDETSSQWQQSLKLLDDILWSIQPQSYAADQQYWVTVTQDVISSLESALTKSRLSQEKAQQLTSTYAEIIAHIKETKGLVTPANSIKIDHTMTIPGATRKSNYPPGSAADQQIHRLERFHLRISELGHSQSLEQQSEALRNLKFGQWLELLRHDGTIRRCRLSEQDTKSKMLLFVARDGHQVLSATIDELLQKLQNGEINLLESTSFWDRSLKLSFNCFTTPSQLETVV